MKKCLFCQTSNNEEALVCTNCGRALLPDAGPTQPLHLRPVQPGWSQPRSPDVTAPYPQPWNQPAPADQYPPDPNQPFPRKAVPQPYRPPPYFVPPPETRQQPLERPVSMPPARAAAPREDRFSFWTLLIIGLGLVLMSMCGLAFFTLSNASANQATAWRAQVSTRVGQVFGSAGSNSPAPTDPLPTAAPTQEPALTPSPQAGIPTILLSPECNGSLEFFGKVSSQAKNDPLIVLQEPWRTDLDQATADLKAHCGSLDSASPIPGEINQVQQFIHQANSEFDQADQLWQQAFDQRDPGKALDAAQHLGEATKYLSQAIDQVQKLTR